MGESLTILALDLATRTGWATTQDGRIESGTVDFSPRRGESAGMRYVRFNSWLAVMILKVKPQVIYYEQSHHRGGAATQIAEGLITRVLEWCALRNIEHVPVHTATLKKFACGRGNAGKPDMIAAFKRKTGKEPEDDNEADAFWLLQYGLADYGNT